MYFEGGRYVPDCYEAEKGAEILVGALKLKKIRQYFAKDQIDWAASCSYADSYSDLDILQAVGNPVAVNPDARLRVTALEKGWQIIGE
jgi:phosphoserine phosphatase